MAFNPFDPALFAVKADCMPCCTTPTECMCALLIPPFASPYADYATAVSAIADQTADCYGYSVEATDVFTVDASVSNEVSVHTELTDAGAFTENWISVTIGASDTLVVDWTNSFVYEPGADEDPAFFCEVYDCNGSMVASDSDVGASGTFSFGGLAEGIYYVRMNAEDEVGDNTSITSDVTVSATTLVPNPVIALWDDSGTTRQLEACPKFILPFPEWTGSWYADCASAESAMGAYTVDCSLFVDVDISTTGYSASLSGTNIDMELSTPDDCVPQEFLNGSICINLVGGESVSISGHTVCSYLVPEEGECPSCNPDFPDECDAFYINISVTGADGSAVASAASESTSLSQSASASFTAPYSGRFYFSVSGGRGNSMFQACCLDSVHVSGSITAETISVNPIQALYDLGLDCPGRLDCGDTCP